MAKKLIENYTFDATAQTLKVRGNYNLKEWLLVTNTTDNIIIYNYGYKPILRC